MSTNINPNMLAEAHNAVRDHLESSKKQGTGDCRVAYALMIAHEERFITGIATYYKEEDKAEKSRILNDCLVHLFETHEYDDKGKAVLRDGTDKRAENPLKQSLRRMFPVVAMLVGAGGSDTVAISKMGFLSVPGSMVYSAEEIEEDENLASNTITIGSKNGKSMAELIRRSRAALGMDSGDKGKGKKDDALAQISITSLADAVNNRVAGIDDDTWGKLHKDTKDALRRLTITLCHQFDVDYSAIDTEEEDAEEAKKSA